MTCRPQSRTTVYVNARAGARLDRRLGRDHGDAADRRGARDVSQHGRPGVRPRPRRRGGGGSRRRRGSSAKARPVPFFDTYLLLANPSAQPASVQVDYLRDQRRRRSAGPTGCRPTAASASTSTASRAWRRRPSGRASRRRCRSSPSARCTGPAASSTTTKATSRPARRRPGSHWVLAEGEQGGPYAAQTFVLIANTGVDAGVGPRADAAGDRCRAEVSDLLHDPGQRAADVSADQACAASAAAGSKWSRRGARPAALVVEGAIYWSAPDQPFGAGANWPATRIP